MPTEHPVKRKLRNEILPYFVTARMLRKKWFFVTYSLFGYTTDILVALTALGVVSPVISGIFASSQTSGGKSTSLADLTATLPKELYYPVLLVVLAWIFLRVAFIREDGQKRAILAKSCYQVVRSAEASLPGILGKSDPMSDLSKLYKDFWPTVQGSIQQDAWVWTPFAPGIENEVESWLEELCRRYEDGWDPADQNGIIGIPTTRGQNG